ncbi:Glycosyltransferase involved in cell wall bisynthesis [Aquiflexum balticum DSM 16537]|uniref:Glycosyltransferase involved in cell wall bisynthesis n=1 Tax=Aquiflexum balticum DSM 16537 TaxID=758820 RepID=A0A1W2HBS4_9BACT|nr:glycosyltransferase family 4 protein [Aquiflexum balticum]SMD46056.1 Glycosyltransferase involved in cell wall bisynthesis [Aquiflexum balticum DSM 16537]
MRTRLFIVVNFLGSKTETFIRDQINYFYAVQPKSTKVLSRGKLDSFIPGNDIFIGFPNSYQVRLKYLLKNIFFFRVEDLFKVVNSIGFVRYYLNLELFYHILFFRKNNLDTQVQTVMCHFGNNGVLYERLKFFNVFSKEVKIFCQFHGLDVNPKKYSKQFYRRLFKNGDGFFCGSQFMKEQVINLGCPGSKISVIPCGIDPWQISEKKYLQDDRINLILVGRLIPLKGIHRSVELAKLLIENNFHKFHFTIVGNGALFEGLLKSISDLELKKYFTVLGEQEHGQVKELMGNSDVFLYLGTADASGRREGQGVSLLEAQVSYLPVLTTDSGGVKEMVLHEKTGFVFEENDLKSIAEKIKWLYHDVELLKKLGQNGRDFVINNFDQKVLFKKLESKILEPKFSD